MLVAMLSVTACTTTATTVTTDSQCLIFRPITYSAKADTKETVRQVREHNAVYGALCEDEKLLR